MKRMLPVIGLIAAGGLLVGVAVSQTNSNKAAVSTKPPVPVSKSQTNTTPVMSNTTKPSKEAALKKLDPLQLHVTQQCGTEPPFRNAYWDNKKPGIYVDIVSGEPLFSSLDKFDSGTGWPSFTRSITKTNVVSKDDKSHGMVRTEVRSKEGDSHLGHLFNDGPAPTGQRYCINSASLRFIPVEKMKDEGYAEYLEPFVKAGKTKAEEK